MHNFGKSMFLYITKFRGGWIENFGQRLACAYNRVHFFLLYSVMQGRQLVFKSCISLILYIMVNKITNCTFSFIGRLSRCPIPKNCWIYVFQIEMFRAIRPGQLGLIEEMTNILKPCSVYIVVVVITACDVYLKWFTSACEFGTLDLHLNLG